MQSSPFFHDRCTTKYIENDWPTGLLPPDSILHIFEKNLKVAHPLVEIGLISTKFATDRYAIWQYLEILIYAKYNWAWSVKRCRRCMHHHRIDWSAAHHISRNYGIYDRDDVIWTPGFSSDFFPFFLHHYQSSLFCFRFVTFFFSH